MGRIRHWNQLMETFIGFGAKVNIRGGGIQEAEVVSESKRAEL